jgi:NAD(P)-dependent dehydrogenase (short-subunit alcohol dehydrogenase family)
MDDTDTSMVYRGGRIMQVAIVTGGSSGIGQSAAIQTAKRGVGVIVTYSAHREGAEETVRIIEHGGGSAAALPLDVGCVETFPEFKNAVVETLRNTWNTASFHSLVNNAGFAQMAMFEDTTEELFDALTRVLFKGPYFLTQALLPLIADGGAIVNTSSNSALASGLEPGYSAYASMKGAVNVLTRAMAKEFSARGIRVNAVAPGPTRTRLGNDAFSKFPELIAPLAARTALGRVGEPDDIGKVIAFLLSDDGAWITAQTIEASGGYGL